MSVLSCDLCDSKVDVKKVCVGGTEEGNVYEQYCKKCTDGDDDSDSSEMTYPVYKHTKTGKTFQCKLYINLPFCFEWYGFERTRIKNVWSGYVMNNMGRGSSCDEFGDFDASEILDAIKQTGRKHLFITSIKELNELLPPVGFYKVK